MRKLPTSLRNRLASKIRDMPQKKCIQCKNIFTPRDGYDAKTRIYCSSTCFHLSQRKRKTKSCGFCKKEFEYQTCRGIVTYCSSKCQYDSYREKRVGENNPNYRGGLWSKDGLYRNSKWGISKQAMKHQNATYRHKQRFIKEHGFVFCEVCGTTQSLQFSTHHIYYASRFPKHQNLHNKLNLIVLCLDCHTKFHAEKYKDVFLKLEKERGLKELFR